MQPISKSARKELVASIATYLTQSTDISDATRAENILSLVEAQNSKYKLKYLRLLRDIMYLHKELVLTSADSDKWYDFLKTAGFTIGKSTLYHSGDVE